MNEVTQLATFLNPHSLLSPTVPAIIRYKGPLHVSTGTWIGVELLKPTGKNDGSIQGRRYFTCAPNYGLFIRPNRLCKTLSTTEDIKTFQRPKSMDEDEGSGDKFDEMAIKKTTPKQRPSLNKFFSFANSAFGLNPPVISTPVKASATAESSTPIEEKVAALPEPPPSSRPSVADERSVDLKDIVHKVLFSPCLSP